jgi:hypothetical protein
MPELNKRYVRVSPNGDESIVSIKSEQELKYQQDLLANGFTFKEIVPTVVPGGTCVSCEG